MKMTISNEILKKQETLKIVQAKLENKRDELMDIINTSLLSSIPTRIEIIYRSQLKLATVEKALEINRFFMVQLQQDILKDLIADDMIKGTLDAVGKKMEEKERMEGD